MQPNQLIWTKEAYTQPAYPLLNTTQFKNFEISKLSHFIKHAMGRISPFSNPQVAKWETCSGIPRQPTCPRNHALLTTSFPFTPLALTWPHTEKKSHRRSPQAPLRITAPCLILACRTNFRVLHSSRNRPLPPSPLPFTWERGALPLEVTLHSHLTSL
jgi:hypothetical protein